MADTYVRDLILQDMENKRGYGQNEAVLTLIQHAFFAKKAESAGVLFAEEFNPFPLPLLAIAITTVSVII